MSEACWKTTARPAAGPITRAPSTVISPESGCRKPAIEDSRVLCPQPEGPMMVRNSPVSTLTLTPSSARVEVSSLLPKLLTTLSTITIGAAFHPGLTGWLAGRAGLRLDRDDLLRRRGVAAVDVARRVAGVGLRVLGGIEARHRLEHELLGRQ